MWKEIDRIMSSLPGLIVFVICLSFMALCCTGLFLLVSLFVLLFGKDHAVDGIFVAASIPSIIVIYQAWRKSR